MQHKIDHDANEVSSPCCKKGGDGWLSLDKIKANVASEVRMQERVDDFERDDSGFEIEGVARRYSVERGASLVEYALLCCMVALAAIAAMQLLGSNISGQFSSVSAQLG